MPEPLASVLRDPVAHDDAVNTLARYEHVRWRPDGESISLHRTVQHFARELLSPDEKATWVDRAVRLVLAAFPDDPTDVAAWPRCQALLLHAPTARDHAPTLGTAPVAPSRRRPPPGGVPAEHRPARPRVVELPARHHRPGHRDGRRSSGGGDRAAAPRRPLA